MNNFVLLIFTCSSLVTAFGQEDFANDKPVPRFSISSIWFDGGFNLSSLSSAQQSDFLAAAPTSSLLNADLTGYKSNYSFGVNSEIISDTYVGWQIRKGETRSYRERLEFRTGIGFSRASHWNLDLSKEDRKAGDTLISLVSGEVFLVDSVHSHSLNANRSSGNVNFDLSALWRTNPAKATQAYFGVGVVGSVAFMSRISVYSTHQDYAEILSSGSGYDRFGDSESELLEETFDVASPKAISFYVPLGITYCLNRKSEEINKKWHLSFELRRGFTITSYPDFGTEGNNYTSLRWGIRYRL